MFGNVYLKYKYIKIWTNRKKELNMESMQNKNNRFKLLVLGNNFLYHLPSYVLIVLNGYWKTCKPVKSLVLLLLHTY